MMKKIQDNLTSMIPIPLEGSIHLEELSFCSNLAEADYSEIEETLSIIEEN